MDDLREAAESLGQAAEPNGVLANVGKFLGRLGFATRSAFSLEFGDMVENSAQAATEIAFPLALFDRELNLPAKAIQGIGNLTGLREGPVTGDFTTRDERPEMTDFLERWDLPRPDKENWGKRLAVDFFGGILTDPISYVTLGGGGLAKGALHGVTRGQAGLKVAAALERTEKGAAALKAGMQAARGQARTATRTLGETADAYSSMRRAMDIVRKQRRAAGKPVASSEELLAEATKIAATREARMARLIKARGAEEAATEAVNAQRVAANMDQAGLIMFGRGRNLDTAGDAYDATIAAMEAGEYTLRHGALRFSGVPLVPRALEKALANRMGAVGQGYLNNWLDYNIVNDVWGAMGKMQAHRLTARALDVPTRAARRVLGNAADDVADPASELVRHAEAAFVDGYDIWGHHIWGAREVAKKFGRKTRAGRERASAGVQEMQMRWANWKASRDWDIADRVMGHVGKWSRGLHQDVFRAATEAEENYASRVRSMEEAYSLAKARHAGAVEQAMARREADAAEALGKFSEPTAEELAERVASVKRELNLEDKLTPQVSHAWGTALRYMEGAYAREQGIRRSVEGAAEAALEGFSPVQHAGMTDFATGLPSHMINRSPDIPWASPEWAKRISDLRSAVAKKAGDEAVAGLEGTRGIQQGLEAGGEWISAVRQGVVPDADMAADALESIMKAFPRWDAEDRLRDAVLGIYDHAKRAAENTKRAEAEALKQIERARRAAFEEAAAIRARQIDLAPPGAPRLDEIASQVRQELLESLHGHGPEVQSAVNAYLDDMAGVLQELKNVGVWKGDIGKANPFYVPHQAARMIQEALQASRGDPKVAIAMRDVFTKYRKTGNLEEFRVALEKALEKAGHDASIFGHDIVEDHFGALWGRRLLAHNRTMFHQNVAREARGRFGMESITDNSAVAAYLRETWAPLLPRSSAVQKLLAATNRVIKPNLTITFPAFHMRNLVSAVLMGFLDPQIGAAGARAVLATIHDAPILSKLGLKPLEGTLFVKAAHGDTKALEALGDLRIGDYTAEEVVRHLRGGVVQKGGGWADLASDMPEVQRVLGEMAAPERWWQKIGRNLEHSAKDSAIERYARSQRGQGHTDIVRHVVDDAAHQAPAAPTTLDPGAARFSRHPLSASAEAQALRERASARLLSEVEQGTVVTRRSVPVSVQRASGGSGAAARFVEPTAGEIARLEDEALEALEAAEQSNPAVMAAWETVARALEDAAAERHRAWYDAFRRNRPEARLDITDIAARGPGSGVPWHVPSLQGRLDSIRDAVARRIANEERAGAIGNRAGDMWHDENVEEFLMSVDDGTVPAAYYVDSAIRAVQLAVPDWPTNHSLQDAMEELEGYAARSAAHEATAAQAVAAQIERARASARPPQSGGRQASVEVPVREVLSGPVRRRGPREADAPLPGSPPGPVVAGPGEILRRGALDLENLNTLNWTAGEKAKLAAGKALQWPTVGPLGFLQRYGLKVANWIENSFRTQAYLTLIKKGVTPEEAANRVAKAYVDYDVQSGVDRWLRDLIPFARFSVAHTPVVVEAVARRPLLMAPVGRTQGSLDSGDGSTTFLPEYLKGGLAAQIGEGKYLTGFGTPMEAAASALQFGEGRAGARRALVGGMNVVPRVLAEGLMDRSSYFGTPLGSYRRAPSWAPDSWTTEVPLGEDRVRREIPGLVNEAIGYSPFSRFSSSIDKLLREDHTAVQKLVNLATGARIVNVDQAKEVRKAAMEVLKDNPEYAAQMEIFFLRDGDAEDIPAEVRGAIEALDFVKKQSREGSGSGGSKRGRGRRRRRRRR